MLYNLMLYSNLEDYFIMQRKIMQIFDLLNQLKSEILWVNFQ